MTTIDKTNLLDLDREGLEEFFVYRGDKPFRATQIIKWIHQHGVDNFDDMSNVSKALREELQSIAEIRAPEVAIDDKSEDGGNIAVDRENYRGTEDNNYHISR